MALRCRRPVPGLLTSHARDILCITMKCGGPEGSVKIILLNGTSSSGKITVAKKLQERYEGVLLLYGIDTLVQTVFPEKCDYPPYEEQTIRATFRFASMNVSLRRGEGGRCRSKTAKSRHFVTAFRIATAKKIRRQEGVQTIKRDFLSYDMGAKNQHVCVVVLACKAHHGRVCAKDGADVSVAICCHGHNLPGSADEDAHAVGMFAKIDGDFLGKIAGVAPGFIEGAKIVKNQALLF